ncbi:hypothetical protein [Fischerella thermalis]|uniref:hypothetical protein n=1 Tax=Fischerella thermalis TaxID=372787 RepID=UPI002155D9D4|nr:hypothetical protein [Fischerella thermalis]
MGRLLGLGMPYTQAKAQYMPNDTVEGASLTLAIAPTVEIPLTMIDIVYHDTPVDISWDKFFAD